MRIRRVILENIRSHKYTEVCFDDGITVISGRTGSGKSSILMAIEYALFGSESRISKELLLRRRELRGRVVLDVEHGGHLITIERVFVREGKSILSKGFSFKVDGVEKLGMKREMDLNHQVALSLGFPERARDLFETTIYTKQDEIRKLLTMSKMERQKYIDEILQLSKYELVWENMREVLRDLERDVSEIEGELKEEPFLREEMKKTEEESERVRKELRELQEEEKESEKKYVEIGERFRRARERLDALEEKRRRYENAKSLVEGKEKELRCLEEEILQLKKEIDGMKVEEIDYDEILREYTSLKEKVNGYEERLRELEREYEEVLSMKAGARCPFCKQEISEEHMGRIREEYEKKRDGLRREKEEKERALVEMGRKLERAREAREKQKAREKKMDELGFKEGKVKELRSEINSLKEEIKEPFDYELLEKVKKEYEMLLEEKEKVGREYERLKERMTGLKERLLELENRAKRLGERLRELERSKERLGKLKEVLMLLSRLREDIRGIRSIVRNIFLGDFRAEFQKRFEEIRRTGEYIVDIKDDYEPVAYTAEGEEVPIASLSGGEKTSVALAYRLALSDIAAQLGGIMRSEVLLLDEPTTGFDEEDIKALPEVLRNIRHIPQIIIVTHEASLKEAADHKFEVEKVKGVSTVS
ncbi:MAG: SMC family ATPase [Nanoarchaeota archaeon]|nr:SMC family ATPase [Nanoarchaeota archaeon]